MIKLVIKQKKLFGKAGGEAVQLRGGGERAERP